MLILRPHGFGDVVARILTCACHYYEARIASLLLPAVKIVLQLTKTHHFDKSCIPIRYFWSVFGWYFLVFTKLIPEKNWVGTFWYYFFGGNPFFP